MVYQVNSNVTALNVYNNLGTHQAKASASLARISSGLKAAGGGDVASQGTAATINASMQTTASNISQVQNAINKLQVADAAYGEMIALGQKGLEVASRASDAGADTSAITAQVAALTAGITSIDANTEYIGGAVLGDATAPTVGAAALTVTPAAVTVPASDNIAGYTAFLSSTIDLRAENAGNIAALQNTLQVLNSVGTNELAAMSQAQDTDIAKEMMSLTSANIMTEAATAMLAQAMQLPNSVLKLLQ